MRKPEVSIIIPTYNSEKTLVSCLNSVVAQTYPFYEIIIVDNFSTDNTLRTARRFKAKVLQRKGNPALARNVGVSKSTGKYVLFLDSDQVLSPTVIQECLQKCQNGQAEMVRIPEIFVGREFWSNCSAVWKNHYQKVEQLYGSTKSIVSGEPRFFARERISQLGMFDTALVWGEDYDLHERLREANAREAMCKSSIYHYELTSLRGILAKNLYYGKYMPTFVQHTHRHILSLMIRHAVLTLREVSRDFRKSPATIVGCVILLCLKAYITTISFPAGLLVDASRR